jgi:hypothetical protein
LHDQNLTFVVLLPSHHHAALALPGVGTFGLRCGFPCMTDTDLFEQSFNIAWSVLERTGELGEPNDTSQFLLDRIANMMSRGERRRLLLSNSAIDAYRRRPIGLVQ